jgi:hypothetical protein
VSPRHILMRQRGTESHARSQRADYARSGSGKVVTELSTNTKWENVGDAHAPLWVQLDEGEEVASAEMRAEFIASKDKQWLTWQRQQVLIHGFRFPAEHSTGREKDGLAHPAETSRTNFLLLRWVWFPNPSTASPPAAESTSHAAGWRVGMWACRPRGLARRRRCQGGEATTRGRGGRSRGRRSWIGTSAHC